MSIVKKNILANFLGSLWKSIMSLILVPICIKFMGIESWGLVGLSLTLQAVFYVLDIGLSSTLTRELAKYSVLSDQKEEMNNLVHTLEKLYWSISIVVSILIMVLSPYIAHHWINAEKLNPATIEQSVFLMGFIIALQMQIEFYTSGLRGLQKQVLLNYIVIVMNTLRVIGAILVLWLISPTIQAFFIWQITINITSICLFKYFLHKKLPNIDAKPVFKKNLIKNIWKFSAGMSGINIMVIILTSADKIVLSKILSLKMFGYYMLASLIVSSIQQFFTTSFHSIYPKLTQLVIINDASRLKKFYHESCQFMAILVFPVTIIVALFSYQVILIWTGNPETSQNTYLLLSILIVGTAVNGILTMPYALQLAFGWTSLSFYKTLIAVVLFIPTIIFMATHYGVIGAALMWPILNIVTLIFEIPLMHSRLLPKEKLRWFINDVCMPLTVCLVIAGLGKFFFPNTLPLIGTVSYIICVSILTVFVVSLTTHASRVWLAQQFSKINL